MATTGERIAEQAEKHGLNLRQLAMKADVPYNTLYAIVKRNSQRVNPMTIMRIASVLDVNPRYLTGESDELTVKEDVKTEGDEAIKYLTKYVGMLDQHSINFWISDLIQRRQNCSEKKADAISNAIIECVLDSKKAEDLLLISKAEPEIIQAIAVLVKASQKGLNVTPVKGHEGTYDVWEKVEESPGGSSSWAIGMDMTAEEAEKLIDNYVSEKENPPQVPENPETE